MKEYKYVKDYDGRPLYDGDRVYSHIEGKSRRYGSLFFDEGWGRWYIEYDDGEEVAVLAFDKIFKA